MKRTLIYRLEPKKWYGGFSAFARHLDILKELAVDYVAVGAFYPKLKWNLTFNLENHKAVSPFYGEMDDFDAFVEKANSLGMKVLIDLMLPNRNDFELVPTTDLTSEEVIKEFEKIIVFWSLSHNVSGFNIDLTKRLCGFPPLTNEIRVKALLNRLFAGRNLFVMTEVGALPKIQERGLAGRTGVVSAVYTKPDFKTLPKKEALIKSIFERRDETIVLYQGQELGEDSRRMPFDLVECEEQRKNPYSCLNLTKLKARDWRNGMINLRIVE